MKNDAIKRAKKDAKNLLKKYSSSVSENHSKAILDKKFDELES